MKVSYKELNQKVSGDLLGVSLSQSSKGKAVQIQHSAFEQVPAGSRVRTKSVSFSKLLAGDYVLATIDDTLQVRRFIGLNLSAGNTRLKLVDGNGSKTEIPFTRLVGRVEMVRRDVTNVDPNPKNGLQRLAFRFRYQFWDRA